VTGPFHRIEVRRRGRILELALNNPGKLNRVDGALHHDLGHVFRWADDDKESRVVILTGAGEAFCAGGDVDWMKATYRGEAEAPSAAEGRRAIWDMLDMDKPLIAKVRGPAIGLGCTLALFSDVVFAAQDAMFADPHVKVGLGPGDGGSAIWPALVGYARAKEFLMSGEPLTGARAAGIGLVNHALPAAELDAAVEAYAEKLLALPFQAVSAAKRGVNLGLKQLTLTIFEASLAHEGLSFAGADHKEAVNAFLEKRKPRFG
jgi:enoyl-CoA hydratase